jgi:protein PhnA
MAKGYQANKEHQEVISLFGKAIGKRAGFKCEWCSHKEELRVWDYRPEEEPELENLALLCLRCREWAAGKKAASNELHDIRNALWSDIPAVAEGAAKVLAQCRDAWARDAIEESFIDDALKAELLK